MQELGATEDPPLASVMERLREQVLPEVQRCYDAEVTERGKIDGEVRIAFMLTPDGDIVHVRVVRTDFDGPLVTRWLLDATEAARLSAVGSAHLVDYPFVFRSEVVSPALSAVPAGAAGTAQAGPATAPRAAAP